MKEIQVEGGDVLNSVALRLVEAAPAFCVFSGIRLEAQPGEKVEAIVARYKAAHNKRVSETAVEHMLVMRRQGWNMMYLGALIALDINQSDAAKTLSDITSSDEEAIEAITRIRHASVSERAAAERQQPSGNPLFPAFQYLREQRSLEAFRRPGAEPTMVCALEREPKNGKGSS